MPRAVGIVEGVGRVVGRLGSNAAHGLLRDGRPVRRRESKAVFRAGVEGIQLGEREEKVVDE